MIAAVGAGAAGSWSINNLGPRMIKRNFDPGFFVDHFIKDMGIALDEAKRMNLSLPGLALANQLYLSVKAQGNGKLGTQALMLALESMNGMKDGISVQKKNWCVCCEKALLQKSTRNWLMKRLFGREPNRRFSLVDIGIASNSFRFSIYRC